jgi:Protein of unknown function (DUF2934)
MNSSSSITHENIARRAHQIWEETGRPEGDDALHWLQAERELHALRERAGEAKADHGKSVEPPVSGKHSSQQTPHSTNYVHPGVTTDSLHHVRNR